MNRFMKMAGLLAALWAAAGTAEAGPGPFEIGGKLLLTRGISNIEGAAGGGLVPFAYIAGNETEDGIGGAAHFTRTAVPDYTFTAYGVGVGIKDRIEFSYTRQELNTHDVGPLLGQQEDFKFGQDVFGAKLRVVGDAVYDQDKLLPQIAVGVFHKRAEHEDLLRLLGAEEANGTEIYVAATKTVAAYGLVLNGALRYTDANQTGLVGFGAAGQDNTREIVPEVTAALQLTPRWLVGGEYRVKPDNLAFAEESDWYDLFTAVAVNKHLSAAVAYTDLGSIGNFDSQRGVYFTVQGAF